MTSHRQGCRYNTVGLAGAGLLVALGVADAAAQEPAADDAAIEEIVVTGSRIKRRDFTSPSPIATIDRTTLEFSSQPTLEETLNQMPQIVPDFGRASNNPGDGTARVNLRGMGAGRTLVLMNGRRLAPSGVGSAVDINNIPQVLIDRVEVITGGATTVYGSDAVAGVVNFITREDFTGLSLDVSGSISAESDAGVYDANIAWGTAFADSRGSITAYAGYQDRDELLAGERELTEVALLTDWETGELYEGGSFTTPDGVIFSRVDFGNGDSRVTFDADGVPREFQIPGDFYNYAPANYLQLPLSRTYAGLFGNYEFTGGKELYLELSYAQNDVVQQLAPVPAGGYISIDVDSPLLTPATRQFFIDHYLVSPGMAEFTIGRRLVEVGPRQVDHERSYWRSVLGLRGDLGSNWEFDTWLTWTEAREHEYYRNDASGSRFLQGLQVDPQTGECTDPSGGCVPIDIFGPGRMSEEAAAFVRIDGVVNDTRRRQVLASGFVRGTLFEAWAGAVDSAFGLEWRSDDASFSADDVLFSGDTLGFNGTAPVDGRESVYEAYGEIILPLVQDATLAEYAGLELGARYSHYDNAGGVWTYKAGGEWTPVSAVRFRAMYQRSVRAPNNYELFTEQYSQDGFAILDGDRDPCSASADPVGKGFVEKCTLQGLAPSQIGVYEAQGAPFAYIQGGNPDLDPEEATTFTVGVVLTPERLPFTLAVDYFELEVTDSIGEIEALPICFSQANTANVFCDNIRRDPTSGEIVQIAQPFSNRGLISTQGVDTQLAYATDLPQWLEAGSAASLDVDVTWTHTFENLFQQNPATEVIDCAGYFGSICSYFVDGGSYSTLPQNRVTANASYTSGPISVRLGARWIDGTKNALPIEYAIYQYPEPVLAIESIGSRYYLDLGVGWNFGDSVTARLGVDNLTDTQPPNMADAAWANNTDAGLFDVFGRTYYLSLTANLLQ